MVERAKSTRRLTGRGGPGRGQGRKPGGMNSTTALALKKARARGVPPAELLHEWALNGVMRDDGKDVRLTPDQRIDCAKACWRAYTAPLQPISEHGSQEQVVRVEIGERALRALSRQKPDKLELLYEVLSMIQQGGAAGLAALPPPSRDGADPARYGDTLRADTETKGSA